VSPCGDTTLQIGHSHKAGEVVKSAGERADGLRLTTAGLLLAFGLALALGSRLTAWG
jgi:hypothetical protein